MLAFIYLKKILPAILSLLLISNVSAAGLMFHNRIQSTALLPVSVGQSSAEAYVEIYGIGCAYRTKSIKDIITFGIDHENMTYFSSEDVFSVVITVDRANLPDTSLTLTVQNKPASPDNFYIDKQTYLFNNQDNYTVTIDTIYVNGVYTADLPEFLYLDAYIYLEAYYYFGNDASTPLTTTQNLIYNDCDAIYDEIEISWNTLCSAEEYQLEWTFINDYNDLVAPFDTLIDPDDLGYNFRNNSTRITTTNTSYNITLVFEHGWLVYRVRALGRDTIDTDKVLYGVWNVAEKDDVYNVASASKYHNIQPHEYDKNWQYSATYAEEGKKKEVISYFDGSLRNRASVTKLNSDNVVIVGQTIYDSQGRPAVNVLPTPVTFPSCTSALSPSIKYYTNFNMDDSLQYHQSALEYAYSRNDFDLDAGACQTSAAAMGTDNGASNYYSPDNPDKSGHQAFLPDAKKYPFTQIQYTPDNTGRISRQSGVGEDFKIGSGHETKYYYGQPNQIQLDRLFGSEVGFASHYKKNLVFDANGQASISYLDMQGRVIATSLAGEASANLEALDSESGAVKTLTVDAFAESNDTSSSNVVMNNESIEFSTQMLVSYTSNYVFNYDMTIDALEPVCSNICYHCVYDLSIIVRSECGDTVADILSSKEYAKTAKKGYFTNQGDTLIIYKTDCTPTEYDYDTGFTLLLTPGNYTVSKTLKLDKDARSFYVQQYLESVNGCAKSVNDFIDEAIANVDTMSCYIDCNACVSALGTRNEWVASGKGTAMQWDVLYEECQEPCKDISLCEATHDQLLEDVKPGGQYGECFYVNPVDGSYSTDPNQFVLSVFNTNNKLPKNLTANEGNWRYPKTKINGIDYNCYIDDNGDSAKITINYFNGAYYPEVISSYDIKHDANGNMYIYPEELKNVEDLINSNYWQSSWAKALVQYHPEYCYYKICSEYSQKQNYTINDTDEHSSDEFDELLRSADSYNSALTQYYLLDTNGVPLNYANETIWPYDPFARDTYFYEVGYPYGIQSTLSNKFTDYNNSGYTMYEIAASTIRCGTQYGNTSFDPTCFDFGTGTNVIIKNAEWNLFKHLYLSEKATLQQKRANAIVIDGIYCSAYNGCIGNSNFSPIGSGFLHLSQGQWFTSPFFDNMQPCYIEHYHLYANKIKRFNSIEDINIDNVPAQLYAETGQCPIAIEMQYWLSAMADGGFLASSTDEDLQNHPEFTQTLYAEVNGGVIPSPFVPLDWEIDDNSNDILNIKIVDNTNILSTIVLDKSASNGYSWDDVSGFTSLQYSHSLGNIDYFNITAKVANSPGSSTQFSYYAVSAHSNINLSNCTFPPQYSTYQIANDLQNLWTALAANGDINSTNAVSLQQSTYSPFITNSIKNVFVASNDNLNWIFINSYPEHYEIYDDNAVDDIMLITFTDFDPPSFTIQNYLNTVKGFTDITSNQSDGFVVKGVDVNGDVIVTITGKVEFDKPTFTVPQIVDMGESIIVSTNFCNGPTYLLREHLEALMHDVLLKNPFSPDINFITSSAYTPLIDSYMPYPTGALGTSSIDSYSYYSGKYHCFIDFQIPKRENYCTMRLFTQHYNDTLKFDDLTFLGKLIPYGTTYGDNYYHFYMLASFLTDGIYYSDTVFGYSSCLPLNICDCPEFFSYDINSCSESENGADDCWKVTAIPAFNFNHVPQHLINPVINNTAITSVYTPYTNLPENKRIMDGAQWYSPLPGGAFINDLGYTDTCWYVYRKVFNIEGSLFDMNIDILSYFEAYVVLNGTHVASIVNSPGNLIPLSLNDYENHLKQGENILEIIVKAHFDNTTTALGVRGYVNSIKPCDYSPVIDSNYTLTPDTIPCVELLYNIAIANAINDYNQYIDSLTTDFSATYTAHCLSAAENFTYTYDDKEYHFTLYYYDQAGNLVKTIPPEGVEMLDITSHTSPKELLVLADRANGTHTVFTEHRMETRYEYNSLNQPVKQVMPDHDKMDIWEYSLPSGLSKHLQITSVQFVNASRGYLTGYTDYAGKTRGYMYATNDGGATWSKINDLVAADLNHVQILPSGIGYAAGSEGVLLKTTDNGKSWDMIPLYKYGVTQNINAVCFRDDINGIIAGDGVALWTNDGGLLFDEITSYNPTITYNSITYDGSKYFVNLTFDSKNSVCNEVSTNGIILNTDMARAKDIQKIYKLDGSSWYAVGSDGTLMTLVDIYSYWETVAALTKGNFKDVHFVTVNYGVAIIENTSGEGQLWNTKDGGINWELLSEPGDYYNAFYFYSDEYAYAVGNDGVIDRIVFSNDIPGNVNLIKISTPNSNADLTAVFANDDGTKLWVATDNTLYYYNNLVASLANWTTVTSNLNVKEIYFNYTQNNGLVVTDIEKVYKIIPVPGTSNYTLTDITTSSEVIGDIQEQDNNIIAYDRYSSSACYLNKNNISSVNNFSFFNNSGSLPDPANFNSIGTSSNVFIAAGKDGDFYHGTLSGTDVIWYDNSLNTYALPVKDLNYAGSTNVYAAGNNGTLMLRSAGSYFKHLITATTANLNAVAPTSTTQGFVAGDDGYFANFNVSPAGDDAQLSQIYIGTAEDLYDIAISGNEMYISGANGTIIYIPDHTAATLVYTVLPVTAGTTDFKSIKFTSAGKAIAVGTGGVVHNFAGTSAVKNKNVFTPSLADAHFFDINNGYVAGDSGTIRRTSDGGATWDVVLPNILAANEIPQAKSIFATGAAKAIIAGKDGYAASVTAGNQPQILVDISTSEDLNDVVVNPSGTGFMAGNNGIVYKTTNFGTSWNLEASSNADINALHIFNDNSLMAVGNSGTIICKNGGSWLTQQPPQAFASTDFYDVFFHDDRTGYVVGDAGVILKCSETENVQQKTQNDVTWIPKRTTGYMAVTDSTHIDIRCIDFPTRYNGFVAGMYNTANYTHHPYARLLHDESELYSTYFWYDRLGRMVLSQNTKQFNKNPKAYSYTTYDPLGRIKEVGEKAENTANYYFTDVFGAYVNNKYNPKTINDNKLNNWITDVSGDRTEVVRTFYDNPIINQANITQDNLRNRIATVTYSEQYNSDSTVYDYATHYSYDIHGNVKTLWQDNKQLADDYPSLANQRFKKLDYKYDLISGNVKMVSYQADSLDAFHHRYEYDADNRITEVSTSRLPNKMLAVAEVAIADAWNKDAKYFYYDHGPLARVELGHNKVQGIDYAYTLQGWLKAVNSETLDTLRDIGRDGDQTAGNSNANFPKDVFGYSLNYFNGDYASITNSNFLADKTNLTNLTSDAPNLYNGNINYMVTSITNPLTQKPLPQLTAYKYDQLNRLLQMKAFDSVNFATNQWEYQNYDNKYFNSFSYDGNGNILTQHRRNAAGKTINHLTYNRLTVNNELVQNRLYHVNDTVDELRFLDDIDDQGLFTYDPEFVNTDNNYAYDELGNLTRNSQKEIDEITWTVTGKVKEVTRSLGSSKKNLRFQYDALGNRAAKHVFDNNWTLEKSEFYFRDATGNVMSIYTMQPNAQQQAISYAQTETYTYGSSRVATNKEQTELISPVPQGNIYSNKLGYKQFELSNHLGNILTTVSDIKEQQDYNSDNEVDCYTAQILSNTDYYPFGVSMTERSYNSTSSRFGFNGKENDEEMETMDFGARLLDGDLGVWLACDPLASKYPDLSTYQFCANNPIIFIDPNGKEIFIVNSNEKANEEFKSLIWLIFDNKVEAMIGENGKLTFKIAQGFNEKDMTKEQFATYNQLNRFASSKDKSIDIKLENTAPLEDKNIADFGDNFYNKTLYTEDINKVAEEFKTGGLALTYHFFTEQWLGKYPNIRSKDFEENEADNQLCQNCLYLYAHNSSIKLSLKNLGIKFENLENKDYKKAILNFTNQDDESIGKIEIIINEKEEFKVKSY